MQTRGEIPSHSGPPPFGGCLSDAPPRGSCCGGPLRPRRVPIGQGPTRIWSLRRSGPPARSGWEPRLVAVARVLHQGAERGRPVGCGDRWTARSPDVRRAHPGDREALQIKGELTLSAGAVRIVRETHRPVAEIAARTGDRRGRAGQRGPQGLRRAERGGGAASRDPPAPNRHARTSAATTRRPHSAPRLLT